MELEIGANESSAADQVEGLLQTGPQQAVQKIELRLSQETPNVA